MNRPFRLALAATSTLALACVVPPPAQAWDLTTPTVMQGSPTPMGQTNGPVWATQIAGGKIFVGGGFTSTRPAGAAAGNSETGRAHLAAFDADTGAPVPGFNPVLRNTWSNNAPIVRSMALSPDKSILYVGGDFNEVNGQKAEHIAAFDTATGQFLGQVGWNGVDGPVNALAVSNDGTTLYAAGAFVRANWSTRRNLAAFNLETGGLRAWSPEISQPVVGEALRAVAIAVSADDSQVFIGGPFRTVNGVAAQGFMGTSATTGANLPRYADGYLFAPSSWGTSLAVKDNTVYLGGRDDRTSSTSRSEGVFAINTDNGSRRWYANCYGDTFAVLPVGDDVYVGSHSHDCSENGGHPELSPRYWLSIHAVNSRTGEEKPYFSTTTGSTSNPDTLLMSRALATDGQQLVMGGGFTNANGSAQSNVARFRTGSSAPDRAAWPSGNSCNGCRYTNLTVLTAADRDDIKLTYEIYRDWSTTNPIATVSRDSFPYRYSTFTLRDTGVQLGQRVYYRVLAKDPSGNAVWSVRTPTMTVGQGTTSGARTSTMGARTTQPQVKASTPAQRAAAAAARQLGLRPDGTRIKGAGRPQTPAPVLDDASVPERQPRRSR